jgi:hypothetical protein
MDSRIPVAFSGFDDRGAESIEAIRLRVAGASAGPSVCVRKSHDFGHVHNGKPEFGLGKTRHACSSH